MVTTGKSELLPFLRPLPSFRRRAALDRGRRGQGPGRSGNVCATTECIRSVSVGNWQGWCGVVQEAMPRYDQTQVPRGPSRKWEIVMEESAERAEGTLTLADVKSEHRILRDIPTDELRSVPLLRGGARLERGERYLDLHNPARGEFPGSGREHVRPGQRVVARSATPPDVWRSLLAACDQVLGIRRRSSAA